MVNENKEKDNTQSSCKNKNKKLIRKCIICGKEIKEGIMCEKCRLKEGSNKKESRLEKEIYVCECGRYKIEGKEAWQFPDFLKQKKHHKQKTQEEYIPKLIEELIEKGIRVKDIKQRLCPSCSRKAGGYYESIIQVRGDEKFTQKIIEEFEDGVKNSLENNAFISNINFLKNGADIYFGSKKLASKITKKIEINNKVNKKITHKLHGIKDGKKIYRQTILIKNMEKREINEKR